MCRPARPAIWPSSPALRWRILVAVELAVLGEGDVVDVEIEAHADRIGGDEVVDIARLVERHLRVAGARATARRAPPRAAALAADQFGDGVDLVGREGDDGRARGRRVIFF
jgi:hypothetical protein